MQTTLVNVPTGIQRDCAFNSSVCSRLNSRPGHIRNSDGAGWPEDAQQAGLETAVVALWDPSLFGRKPPFVRVGKTSR
jgi:hypothetical protein